MPQNSQVQKSKTITEGNIRAQDYFSIIVFTLYLLVDFVPQFDCYNYAEPQCLYLNYINIGVLCYLIFIEKKISIHALKKLFLDKITFLYIIFLAFSAISISMSFNIDESLITIVRYLITFIAFFNLYFVLQDKSHLLLLLSITISLVLFIECWKGLLIFFENIGKVNVDSLRSMMTTNHANKNIFSANVLVKIPFVFYALIYTKNWHRLFFMFTLCTSFLTIYLLSARAIIIGLFLMVLIILIGYLYKGLKTKTIQSNLPLVCGVTAALFAILYFSVFIVKKNNFVFDKNGDKQRIENGTENRLKNISSKTESLQIRMHYWQSSIEIIKQNPFLGCGLGSWKIRSMPFENQWKQNNSNGIHMHNDFLEVAAETGILNGLIYTLIFILLIFTNLKKILKSQSENQSSMALMLLASIIGYCIDSFFNFPLSQPTMQIIFVILVILTIHNSFPKDLLNIVSVKKNIATPVILLLISGATVYPNYLMFQFYKGINITKIDSVNLNLNFDQVNALFTDFPSLDDTASPVNDIKTRYLIKENKFEDALKSIKISNKINPYSLYSNSLRVEMYDKMKQYDSVYKYNKILFLAQPCYPLFYERYIMSLARKKDTAGILNTFRQLKPEFKQPKHYAYTFSYLLNAGLPPKESYKVVEQGLSKFPADSLLLDIEKDFSKMLIATGQTSNKKNNEPLMDYGKALNFYLSAYQKNKKNFVNIENIGVCYYQQKKYDLAIPYLQLVIDNKDFGNGKSEYIMALCYYYKNDFKKACEYAILSSNKNYPDASQVQKMSCK